MSHSYFEQSSVIAACERRAKISRLAAKVRRRLLIGDMMLFDLICLDGSDDKLQVSTTGCLYSHILDDDLSTW